MEQAPLLSSKSTTYNNTTNNIHNEKNNKSLWSSLWASKSYIILAAIVLAIIGGSAFFFVGKSHNTHGKWGHHSFVNLEQERQVASKWEFKRELPEHNMIEISIAIRQQNFDELHETLKSVSDPLSDDYGKFKTFEEVHEMLAPSEETISKINEFLDYHEITKHDILYETPNRDFIKMRIPVWKANDMFNAKYSEFEHSESGESAIRVKDHYQIHEHLVDHIDYVSPSVRLPIKGKLKSIEAVSPLDAAKLKSISKTGDSNSDSTSSDSIYIYPSKLWSLYHVNSEYVPTSTKSFQVVASFLSEWYDDKDLSTFWTDFGISETNVKRMPDYQPDGYGSEAELDVQYITSMGQGVNTVVWDIEDDNYFLTLLQQIQTLNMIPSVVSMSYGGDEQSNGKEYCIRGNKEFAKVSLMGTTFFASSGDDGSVSSDGTVDENGMYTPSFPASSVYVTAVGGTYAGKIQDSTIGTNTQEIAWYNSGSGFSVYLDAKEYQYNAQNTFFEKSSAKNELPPSIRFRVDGAGYPDLAAQSVAYIICYEDGLYAVSGTSCSCPTVAGMFSLIVDERLSKGLSKLGWINPTLYTLGEMNQDLYFNDVIDGYNEGYVDDDSIAFYAQEGWDAVTGWGTPKWDQLSKAFVNIQDTKQKIKQWKLSKSQKEEQNIKSSKNKKSKKSNRITNHN